LTAQTLFFFKTKNGKKKIQRGDEIDQLILIEIQIIDVVELVVIKGYKYLVKDMIQ